MSQYRGPSGRPTAFAAVIGAALVMPLAVASAQTGAPSSSTATAPVPSAPPPGTPQSPPQNAGQPAQNTAPPAQNAPPPAQTPPAQSTAQTPASRTPQGAAQAPQQGGAAAQGSAAQGPRDPEVERRIADLHKRLKITPQQETQFNAFADVMRSNAQAMAMLAQKAQQDQKPNAVEDLRAYEQFTEAHAEGLKRLIPPFQALYDSLNDQQKKTADAVLGHAAAQAEQRQGRPRR